jgi:alpha-L-fucosidase
MSGEAVIRQLQHGDADGAVWRPGECDVSIRPGWFYHAAEDDRLRTTDNLVDLYFASVGRNAKLLLNVPATPAGRFHASDVQRLGEMRTRLDRLFGRLALSAVLDFATNADTGFERPLDTRTPIVIADLREDITRGQAVARYTLEGFDGARWSVLSRGTTIGHRKLDRLQPVRLERVRLTVHESIAWPFRVSLRLYASG